MDTVNRRQSTYISLWLPLMGCAYQMEIMMGFAAGQCVCLKYPRGQARSRHQLARWQLRMAIENRLPDNALGVSKIATKISLTRSCARSHFQHTRIDQSNTEEFSSVVIRELWSPHIRRTAQSLRLYGNKENKNLKCRKYSKVFNQLKSWN